MRIDMADVRVRTRTRRADPAAAARPRDRVAYLDGIRGIAVLLVLMYHAWAFHLPVPLRFGGGYIGVDVFFVLSGYVITSVLIHRDRDRPTLQRYTRFIGARFHRLYPALVAMLVAVVVVVWAGWRPDADQSPGHVTAWAGIAVVQLTSFVLAAHTGTPNLVGPTWTLSIEWTFYALWPFALWLCLRARRPWLPVGGLAVAVYAISFLIPAHVWWVLPPGRIAQILVGATFAVWMAGPGASAAMSLAARRGAAVLGFAGLAFILMWSLRVTYGPAYYTYRQTGAPLVTLSAVAMLRGGVRSTLVSRALAWRPLAAVGRASYSLYLIQYPWMYAFGGLSGATRSWGNFALAMTGVAVSTYVSYRFFERPYLRRSSQSRAIPKPAAA